MTHDPLVEDRQVDTIGLPVSLSMVPKLHSALLHLCTTCITGALIGTSFWVNLPPEFSTMFKQNQLVEVVWTCH